MQNHGSEQQIHNKNHDRHICNPNRDFCRVSVIGLSRKRRRAGRVRIKSIDTSELKLGTPSKATITIFNNGNDAIAKERIIMTATAVKLDNWLANKALKTKSDEEKTETYEMTFTETIESGFTETIESGESCTLCAEFNLPAKVSGVSIAGRYYATIEVYADDTLIGTENMDLHLQS